MQRVNFTQYDELPEAMVNYMRHYGPHFNHKLCDFAVSKMRKKDGPIKPYTREELNQILVRWGVNIKHNQLYDFVYVGNMCKADFLNSSIVDEAHLAKYIRDVIDDEDAYDGIVFNRWYADMCYTGIAIDWEDML